MLKKSIGNYDETEPWTPYVVIKYQYNPADIVGRFEKARQEYKTTRGIRVHSVVTQSFNRDATLEEYRSYIKGFDKVFGGINNVSKIKSIPDTFAVVVGIVNKSLYHEGVSGDNDDLDYEELFRLLSYRGFDPLKPIRNRQIEYSRELGVKIRMAIQRGDMLDTVFNTILKEFSRNLMDVVKNYIDGGEKPKLADGTMKWREGKLSQNKSLYKGSRGIDEPLFESGQLHDAIESDYITYQSQGMRSLAKQLVTLADSIKKGVMKHKNRVAKVEHRKDIAKKIGELVAQRNRTTTPAMIATAIMHVEESWKKPELFKYAKKLPRVFKNPTKKQLESMGIKMLPVVGLRKISIPNQIIKAMLAVQQAKDPVEKQIAESTLEYWKALHKKKGRFTLKEIGYTSVARSADIEKFANTIASMDEDNEIYGGRTSGTMRSNAPVSEIAGVSIRKALGVASAYHDYVKQRKSQYEIFRIINRELGATVPDVRLALALDYVVSKYGMEYS